MTKRWHPIDHEHEWRAAVIERLDALAERLDRALSWPVTSSPVTHPAPPAQVPAPSSDAPPGVPCLVCGRVFRSDHALRVHLTRAHRV